ncbi:MAG: nucleotide exchange factor GrpE [Actinobacteria bacterium]|nr:nucleotide exchange factor GrpE [Actinomycetota bacterium]
MTAARKRAEVDPELSQDLGPELELRGDQLSADLAEAREEAARNLEVAQRTQAEFENYRKRVQREQEDLLKRSGERVVVSLLPAIDNLERAIAHAAESGESQLLTGVEMVLSQLQDVMRKEGVAAIDPTGQPFDPTVHQAVGQREDVDVAEGTVLEVYQKGYTLSERVIRPAAVVVSFGGPAQEG